MAELGQELNVIEAHSIEVRKPTGELVKLTDVCSSPRMIIRLRLVGELDEIGDSNGSLGTGKLSGHGPNGYRGVAYYRYQLDRHETHTMNSIH